MSIEKRGSRWTTRIGGKSEPCSGLILYRDTKGETKFPMSTQGVLWWAQSLNGKWSCMLFCGKKSGFCFQA